MFQSLRSRLILLLALALLPAGTLAMVQAFANFEQVKALTERNLLQSSAIVASEEKNEILIARDALQKFAALPEVAAFTAGACAQAMLRLREESVRYDQVVVLRLDGLMACASDLDRPPSFADQEWFMRTLGNDDFTVTGNVVLPAGETPMLLASLPLRGANEEVVGVAAMTLRQAWLKDLLYRADGQALANTNVALLDRRGTVLAESRVADAESDWLPAAFVIGARLSGQAQVFRTAGRDGIERIFALAPLYEQQVYVVMGGISGRLLTKPGLHLLAGLAYPVLMWAIAIAVAWFAVDRLVLRQVMRLRRTANAYAEGHLEARTPGIEDAPNELRELGTTMHKMADVISLHESELRNSLQEQKALLREVHHRVKNNLQVVSSLVNLQASRARNDHERTILRTTQDRIHALAMVHSNLYETPELHRIELRDFVPQLCEFLRQAHGEAAAGLRMTFEIDPLRSDAERAVPLALLITEVVTNALHEGCPDGQDGLLAISLKHDGKDTMVMTIADYGSATEAASPESLGGRLIQGFAKQLGGEVTVESGEGFRLTLHMPLR